MSEPQLSNLALYLQRLGFAAATQAEHERSGVEPDERLLWRPVADAPAADRR